MKSLVATILLCYFLNLADSYRLIELKSDWLLTNGTHWVPNVELPSGVHSTLRKADIIKDVLLGWNDVDLRWVANMNWTYETSFNATEEFVLHDFTFLTFYGIDTVAEIKFNGMSLGRPDNMFTRYSYNIKSVLKYYQINRIEVHIRSPIEAALSLADYNYKVPPTCPPEEFKGECHINLLRKVQSSFGWSNAPAIPTMGIWKPVMLELYNTAIIRDVTYTLEQDESFWYVDIQVYLEMGRFSGLRRSGDLSAEFIDLVNLPEAKIVKCIAIETDLYGECMESLQIRLPKNAVKRWWPNGYGDGQNVYALLVKFQDKTELLSAREVTSERVIKVGFRTVEIIEVPVGEQEGLSFRFKVNDVYMFMKGAVYVPASVFPERTYKETALRDILRSARDANMNLLRVWGGGYYESDMFYNLADEYGILIWQDALFANSMYPTNIGYTIDIETEIKQNVRRLQSHPSLIVWCLNYGVEHALTENMFTTEEEYEFYAEKYVNLFNKTVRRFVAQNDRWRPILLTSPGYGTQVPDDPFAFIGGDPNNPNYADIHFFNQSQNLWEPRNYPRPRFASSFGHQSISSRERWVKALLGSSAEIDKLIAHRQHLVNGSEYMDEQISLNLPELDKDDTNYWKNYIYFTQISQAIAVQSQAATYRVENGRPNSRNTMGAIMWHFNELWTAPSSSVIETNGRRKILWFYLEQIFSTETVIAQMNDEDKMDIFIINETDKDVRYEIIVRIYKANTLAHMEEISEIHEVISNTVLLAKTFNIMEWIADRGEDPRQYFVKIILRHENGYSTASRDFISIVVPKDYINIKDPELEIIIGEHSCFKDENQAIVSIEIRICAPAFFLFFELNLGEIDEYEFSNNGFIQVEPVKVVHLRFKDPVEECGTRITGDDLDVLTLNQFFL